MDPAGIVSIIGAGLGIAKTAISSVQHLYELKETYENINLSVSGLLFKLQSISFSLTTLEKWAQTQASQTGNAELLRQLGQSIKSCNSVISCIDVKVKDVAAKLSVWKKVKHLWNEDVVRGFERDLDSQISALQLLLQTAQFTNSALQSQMLEDVDTRTILQKAKDVGSVYELDSLTIGQASESIEFSFDDQIVNSTTYRTAWMKQESRNQARSSAALPSVANGAPQRKSIIGRLFSSRSNYDPTSRDGFDEVPSQNSWIKTPSSSKLLQEGSKTGSSKPALSNQEQEKVQEQLLIWSSKGSVKMVQTLLDHGARPSAFRPSNGRGKRTAKGQWRDHQSDCLVAAVKAGSSDVADLLLQNGANPGSTDVHAYETCLAIAVRDNTSGDQMLETLLKHGAKTDGDFCLSGQGKDLDCGYFGNILHFIIFNVHNCQRIHGMIRVLERYVELKGMEKLLQGWSVLRTRLYHARSPRSARIADASCYTPLQLLCLSKFSNGQHRNEHLSSLVAYLVERGARLHDPFGSHTSSDHRDLLVSLCSSKEGLNSAVHALLEAGADPDTLETKGPYRGYSVLQISCLAGNEDTALTLVEAGANVHILNLEGKSILLLAISQRMAKLAMSLIPQGVDANEADINGTTPLMEQCKQPTAEIDLIKVLLATDADVLAVDDAGMNAWSYACQQSDVELVKYLQGRTGIPARRKSGKLNHSGLWFAVNGDNDTVLEFLLNQLSPSSPGQLEYLPKAALRAKGHNCVRVFLRRGVAYESVLGEGTPERAVFDRVKKEMIDEGILPYDGALDFD